MVDITTVQRIETNSQLAPKAMKWSDIQSSVKDVTIDPYKHRTAITIRSTGRFVDISPTSATNMRSKTVAMLMLL
jgi:hypothetical protein